MTHKSKLLGACGLYCGACAIFLAKDHPQLAVAP
jgi:hypothetical protein